MKNKKEMTNRLGKDILIKYLGNIGIYTIVTILVALMAYIMIDSKMKYGDIPQKSALGFFHDNWIIPLAIFILAGSLIISCYYVIKFVGILGDITSAVSDMTGENVTGVKLPSQMYEVEQELNNIITTMQKDKAMAEEAEQRRNDLIVYMAHDLKTPLTSVIGYLTLLRDSNHISEEDKANYIRIALNKAQREEDLLNEFFEMTKYSFADTVLSLSKINLSRMMIQFASELEAVYSERGLKIETDVEPGVMLMCDVDRISRVLENLFKNAYNYCYENSVVKATLRKIPGPKFSTVQITVSNPGETIPPEKLKHIFDQFFRVDSARGSGTGGSGLGLAIVKEVVTLHGGTVECTSENETVTFKVEIPTVDVPEE